MPVAVIDTMLYLSTDTIAELNTARRGISSTASTMERFQPLT